MVGILRIKVNGNGDFRGKVAGKNAKLFYVTIFKMSKFSWKGFGASHKDVAFRMKSWFF